MSILIKGMEMPERCWDCDLCYDCYYCRPLGVRFTDREDFEPGERRLSDCPLVPVPPLVRGEWKLNHDGSGTCSVCHFTQFSVWDDDGWQNFCGHCGADMRAEPPKEENYGREV